MIGTILNRTCGGGGASGVMLANRLSPTTPRRPTLNPSSHPHNRHRNNKQIQNHYQKDCNEQVLSSRRQQKSSKTCMQTFEFEDENIRPPASNSSSNYPTSYLIPLSSSPTISSSSVLTNILENKRQSSDDTYKAFCNNHSTTATFNDLETRKRRRLVHSTTRSSQHRLLNLTTLLGIIIIVCLFPTPQQFCNAQDILSRVPAGIFSSPSTSSRNSGTDNNLGSNNHQHQNGNHFGCDCMEYWTCILGGGTPYSYCGIHAHDVCCFVPANAEPVGILPTQSHSRCGKKGQDSGRDGEADMAEWPWHAAILEKPQDLYVCGSTLLDESWILTAAHCVDDYLPFVHNIRDILKVRLGEYDVSTTAEPLRHEEFNITDIVVYPGFNNSTLVHDIALLRLERPAKRKQNIDVVCMPKPDDFKQPTSSRSSVKCYVTGWGRRTETSEHSLVLKEIKVPLWNHDTCNGALQAQFGPAYILPSTALCAGSEGKDACDGDGGGPLVCEKDDQWYQVGIVSFGIGCGRRNVPGVYTNVEAYGPWIEETILAAKQGGSHHNSGGHHNDLRSNSEDTGRRHGRRNR